MTASEARGDLWRVAVDGRWLVFDPRRKRAHLLNPSAVLVLDLLDGQRSLDDVVEQCAAATGDLPDSGCSLRSDVADAIDNLIAEGLAVTDASSVDDAPTELPLTTDEPVVVREAPHRTRRFLGIETAFDVATDDPALADRLDHLLIALAEPDVGSGDDQVVHHYTITTDASTATIALDDLVVVRLSVGPLVLQYVLWHIDRLVVATTTRHLLLHSGAVLDDGGVTVLAGVMNSGKSTLTAALVRDGLGFVTDEMVALDVGDQLVTPFPRPITLEAGSWPLFDTTAHEGAHASNGSRRYLDPDRDFVAARRPISHLVFPEFVAGAEVELTPIAPADAALELARHTFTLDEDGLTALAELAVRVPAVRLRHPGIEVAVPALRRWLDH